MFANRDGVFGETISAYEQPDYEGQIQQLEKENDNLKQKNYVMSGLLNSKEKEIVEKLQRLQDMQNECDTCIRQDCEVARLQTNLKEANEKLDNIKTLNRSQVEETIEDIFVNHKWVQRLSENAVTGDVDIMEAIDDLVTAICNLAIPTVDRDIITGILASHFGTWSMPVGFNPRNYTAFMRSIANEIIKSIGGK